MRRIPLLRNSRKTNCGEKPFLTRLAVRAAPFTLKKIIWGTAGTFVALFPAYLLAHIAGPDPRYTGAPGDNPLACATSTCHTSSPMGGPVIKGSGVTATFSSGCTYTPGVPVTITVTVVDTVAPVNTHYGFQMTARLESNLTQGQAGDFTAGANQIVICDDGSFKSGKGCPAQFPVEFIEHSFCSTCQASTTPYTFTWTPPATNVGNIHFYVAGNAVNGNLQADGGDHVYENSYVLSPVQPLTATPSVLGLTNAASFAKDANGNGSAVAPGSLVTIFGTNFGSAAADAASAPFANCLSGVSVTFNGIAAPVRDVSPAGAYPFVNAQLPFEVLKGLTTGSVPVVVAVNGVTSMPQSVPVVAAAPGVFTIPPGVGTAVLVNLTDYKVAAPTTANLGVASRPINRGESAFMYVTGLGALSPTLQDGFGDSQVLHLAASPIIWIGGVATGVKASVAGAAQAGPYPGVDQINLTIPMNAPTGNAVQVQVLSADGSVISPANVATIAIQ